MLVFPLLAHLSSVSIPSPLVTTSTILDGHLFFGDSSPYLLSLLVCSDKRHLFIKTSMTYFSWMHSSMVCCGSSGSDNILSYSSFTTTCVKLSIHDFKLSLFPCVLPWRAVIVTGCLFRVVKWVVKLSHRSIHKSMLSSYITLNHSLANLVSVSANSLHLTA